MNLRSTLVCGTTVLALSLGLAACGSDDASSSSSATNDASTAAVAEAKAFAEPLLTNPVGVGYESAISKAAPSDILAVSLENTVPITKRVNDEREKAAALLGWRHVRVQVGSGAEDPAKAMDTALNMKPQPDVIFEAGYGATQLAAQLERAKRDGVVVVGECILDEPVGALVGTRCDAASADQQAKASAAYIVANGTQHDTVQLFGTSVFPILGAYNESFIKYMKQWCPGCTVNNNEFQLTDIGTKLPGSVVSAIQRDPKTDWVMFGFGDAMAGVDPALASAGLADKVKIGGAIPGPDQYKQLRDGKHEFWVQNISPFIGFLETDLAVRALVGDSLDPVLDAELPNQVLTADNIGGSVFDGDFWIGYKNYVKDFQKMWLLN